MASITFHPSIKSIDLDEILAASLQENRLDPKLLYVTPRQAELWREVSRKHSPIHTNPEFTRIYRDAYAQIADEIPAGKIHVIGLGPGTGSKETDLAARLQSLGRKVRFTAIDVSEGLVEEASKRVAATGASEDRHLVCDLGELAYIKEWLDASDRDLPRLFTFFGMVPNLEPEFAGRLIRDLLRPGDTLLASVHLAPVRGELGTDEAMKKILPQYDNAETLAWLREGLAQWNLAAQTKDLRIVTDWKGDIPCIRGLTSWNTNSQDPFQLFFSLRYTPELFEKLLMQSKFRGEMLAITACREEAIWAVRSPHPRD